MNVFGVGTGEIILILIIAMIIMGPERMVKLSGELGRLMVKLRRETDGVTKEFREAFSSEITEIQDAAKDLQGAARDLKGAATDVETAAKGVTDVVNQPVAPANAVTPKPAAATTHRPATGTAAKAMPAPQALAGAAFLDGETAVEETIVRVMADAQPDGVTEQDAEVYVVDAGELDDTSVVLDVAELVAEEEELPPTEALLDVLEAPDVITLDEAELSDVSPSEGDSHDA
ncbi:MAG: twin-arginine translocase TatA/TatE family subunit [Anaerolineae bacterium]